MIACRLSASPLSLSVTFTASVRFGALSKSATVSACTILCVSVTISSTGSASSSPLTVTVCAVFQLVASYVSDVGATLAASPSLLDTATTTEPEGRLLRRTPYVPLLSSVTASGVLRLSTSAGGAGCTVSALLRMLSLPECPAARARTRRLTLLDKAAPV